MITVLIAGPGIYRHGIAQTIKEAWHDPALVTTIDDVNLDAEADQEDSHEFEFRKAVAQGQEVVIILSNEDFASEI